MKKMIQKASVVLFALFTLTSNAQDQGNALDSSSEKKNAVAAYFGFPGFGGVGYARKFSDHTALRVAGTFAGISRDMNDLDVGERKIDATASWKFNKIDLLFDYTPFKESSFKLVAGLAYIYNGKTSVSAIPAKDETVMVGTDPLIIPKEDLGVNATADWTGIAPYIATGFGRAVPKNNVGFGFELGGYFIGSPDVSYQSTGTAAVAEEYGLVNIEEESKDFKEAVDKIKFMPSLMFHFTIKL